MTAPFPPLPPLDSLPLFLPRLVELRAFASDVALLLLVGGLAMLTVIMVLVGVQNVVPEKPTPVGTSAPQMRLWPRRPKKVASGLPVDRAMARIVHLKLGEPRILQARSRTTRVRLYGCGCAGAAHDDSSPAAIAAGGPTCGRERGGVEQAFRDVYGAKVAAWEISCRRRGDDACEFEVRH